MGAFALARAPAAVARELGVGEYLILGGGELKSGGNRRDSILADALEALIGAIVIDGGEDACRDVVLKWFADRLEQISPQSVRKDAKTRLQEWMQGQRLPLPEYQIVETTGALHAQTFTVECRLPSLNQAARGSGGSRREAENAAAAKLLEELQVHD